MPRGAAASSVVVVFGFVSACTAAIGRPADLSPLDAVIMVAPRGESSVNHVARAELMPLQAMSIEDALRQIRPEWLRLNPSSRQAAEPARASVYVDNTYVGELDALRLIPVSAVIDVRFLAPSAARDRFGSGCRCEAGVILVATRNDN